MDNVLVRAIAQRRGISATYNRGRLRLDPHMLFFRRGEAYVLARNVEKPETVSVGPRLGQFKLIGLSDIRLEAHEFEPLPGFDGGAPQPDDEVLVAVDLA